MTKDPRYFCDAQRHLVCVPFSVAGLHAMARDLGIKRCCFHGGDKPHYDIPKRMIEQVRARCELVSPRQILRIIRTGSTRD